MRGARIITALLAVMLMVMCAVCAVQVRRSRTEESALGELNAGIEALRAELEECRSTRAALEAEAEALEEEKTEEKEMLELWTEKNRELEELIGS